MTPLADVARAMFAAAVAAVQPDDLLRRLHFLADGVGFEGVELRPAGRLVLVALGKAAPGLTAAFQRHACRPPDITFALAPYGVEAPKKVEPHLRRAAHPLPDAAGEAATGELLDLLGGLSDDDAVVVLLSGGSSALLAAPLPGIERERVTELTKAVMAAGADIGELNSVRKHLLAATGGRLAEACPASMLTLAISDVPGDDLATIASGPTVGDPTTYSDAHAVLERRGLVERFADVASLFRDGIAGARPESPKPASITLARSTVRLLGSSREALGAAATVARQAGFIPVEITRRFRGEARELGTVLAGLGRSVTGSDPVALLLAGESTVTVRGGGRGGRNLELALAAALALAHVPDRCILAGGTDGVDGASPAAGAVVDGQTVQRGGALGRDVAAALAENDSWGFFEGLEEAIVTGPTGTNVADLAFVLIAGQPREYVPRDVAVADTYAPFTA